MGTPAGSDAFGDNAVPMHSTVAQHPALLTTDPDLSLQAPTSASLRGALGRFATGVTIVTARAANGRLVGLTASSFNSVSLSPPLVLWSLARSAASMAVLSTGTHYAINVLSARQRDLAERFATRGVDRWEGVRYRLGESGAPLLEGSVAVFECHNRSRYEEGDHVIFVGEVERCAHRTDAAPLLYHGGRFYTEHPL
jgi:flavin reductase (DIM6/NTAB) family NADH-FMN oxidoreductase RutF